MELGPYPAIVRDWHDGDTAHIDVDLGFAMFALAHDLIDGKPILSARIFGINAPELSTDAGQAAKVYAERLCPPGTIVVATSHSWDKYGGRWDATVTLPTEHPLKDGTNSNDFATLMLDAGQAVVL